MALRLARPEDAPALLAIYGQYIDTTITLEYELPDEAEFTRRVATTLERYPYLVWEEDGVLLGYAYAHPERTREGYQWNAELSIYLDRSAVGRGLGTRLFGALLDLLTAQGVRTVYGVVTLPNPASEALHHAFGFHELGVHRNTGYKNGRWVDVVWFDRALSSYPQTPAPVIPLPQLDSGILEDILAARSR